MTLASGDSAAAPYVLGHSAEELQRLTLQARLLAPITRRLLLAAGVASGMRVLDVGSGMGDVAFLAAELVGPAGHVVGADRAPSAVAQARERAKAESVTNVRFVEGDPSEMPFDRLFDAVVGRYVLMYQQDPAATLRALATRLKTGGLIVFHELDWGGARSSPPAPTYDQCCRWVIDALRCGGADPYMGTKLYSVFAQAALLPPVMHLEPPIGGSADPSGRVRTSCKQSFQGRWSQLLSSSALRRHPKLTWKAFPGAYTRKSPNSAALSSGVQRSGLGRAHHEGAMRDGSLRTQRRRLCWEKNSENSRTRSLADRSCLQPPQCWAWRLSYR